MPQAVPDAATCHMGGKSGSPRALERDLLRPMIGMTQETEFLSGALRNDGLFA